jgi:TonB family protein
MNPQPIIPPSTRPGWWSRNWKWFVPVSVFSLLAFGAIIIGLIFTVVMGSIKSSVPYTRAMAQAKADPDLVAELGTPIDSGWYVTGSISSSGSSSHADLNIPISGPKGSGTLHVIALKSPFATGTDDWKITVLEARVNGRPETIFLGAKNYGAPVMRAADLAPVNSSAPGIRRGVAGGAPNTTPGTDVNEPPPPPPLAGNIKGPVSGGVLNGKAINLPTPPYPQVAKAVGAKGIVLVQVTLDENGKVTSARAVTGHPLLRAAAEAAARGARFTPTKLSGQAVKVSGTITYNFTP